LIIPEKGNSTLEDIGYAFGAMANLQDVVAWTNGTNVELVTEKPTKYDLWSHSAIVNEKDGINISVGPDPRVESKEISELLRLRRGKMWPNYSDSGSKVQINNVNKMVLQSYTSRIQNGLVKWNILGNSCVSHAAKALWMVGIPNLGGWHPYFLHFQMLIRQLGIYSASYLIHY